MGCPYPPFGTQIVKNKKMIENVSTKCINFELISEGPMLALSRTFNSKLHNVFCFTNR